MTNQTSTIILHSIHDLIKINKYKSISVRECIASNFDLMNNYVINDPSFCLNHYAINQLILHNRFVSDIFLTINNEKLTQYYSAIEQINQRFNHLYYSNHYSDGMWQGIDFYLAFSGDKNENRFRGRVDWYQDKLNWEDLINKMVLDSYEIKITCEVLNKLGGDSRIIKYDLNSEMNFGKFYGIKIKDIIDTSSNDIMEYILKFTWFSLSEEATEYLSKYRQFHFAFLYDIVSQKNKYQESYKEAEVRARNQYVSNRKSRDLEFESDYSGSFAYDEAGFSDDDIDSAFDGDPDNYWNID